MVRGWRQAERSPITTAAAAATTVTPSGEQVHHTLVPRAHRSLHVAALHSPPGPTTTNTRTHTHTPAPLSPYWPCSGKMLRCVTLARTSMPPPSLPLSLPSLRSSSSSPPGGGRPSRWPRHPVATRRARHRKHRITAPQHSNTLTPQHPTLHPPTPQHSTPAPALAAFFPAPTITFRSLHHKRSD